MPDLVGIKGNHILFFIFCVLQQQFSKKGIPSQRAFQKAMGLLQLQDYRAVLTTSVSSILVVGPDGGTEAS